MGNTFVHLTFVLPLQVSNENGVRNERLEVPKLPTVERGARQILHPVRLSRYQTLSHTGRHHNQRIPSEKDSSMRHNLFAGDTVKLGREIETWYLPRTQQPDGYETRVTRDSGDEVELVSVDGDEITTTTVIDGEDYEFVIGLTDIDHECDCDPDEDREPLVAWY